MHKFWLPFTTDFLKYFASSVAPLINGKVFVVLWGLPAQGLEDDAKGKNIEILKWGHPSPLNSANRNPENVKNFIHCNHFAKIGKTWKINWDPDDTAHELLVYTDGACQGNGKKSAKASYAAYFPDEKKVLYGCVPGTGFIWKNTDVVSTTVAVTPTNNRGELLGLIFALKYFLASGAAKLHVVSDSQYAILSLQKIKSRIEDKKFMKKPNPDLLTTLHNILMDIAKKVGGDWNGVISTQHQAAHLGKGEKANLTEDDAKNCKGNETADKYCAEAIHDGIKFGSEKYI
jgi:ribonuclease HI